MKLTTKLILAFLVISLFSTGIVVLSTRAFANREFDRFINDRYQSDLIEELKQHYAINNQWDGVEQYLSQNSRFKFDERHPPFFSIADPSGRIIISSAGHRKGDVLQAAELAKGEPIYQHDQIIGILILDTPLDRNPMESEYIRRVNAAIFISGLGTLLLAFILGAILSRTITRPILELTKATHQIADEKFNQQVSVRSRDEIGELAESFNKMNNDLARSFNLRKQMTADIAHELRTPLSLILGHAEAVHDGVLPPTTENFEIIREEAERLEKMVNDLRTLSLADAGELSVDFQLVEINKLLGDIQSHYLIPFSNKRVTLDLEVDSAPLNANLDPARFSQALTNILDNALHYTPEDGRVTLSAKQIGGEIEIQIADNGGGISPEEAGRIFDRFYRADESRARDDGGSGLGLAITKSIIEMHKGRIWAESEKGKGLKMVIRLKRIENRE